MTEEQKDWLTVADIKRIKAFAHRPHLLERAWDHPVGKWAMFCFWELVLVFYCGIKHVLDPYAEERRQRAMSVLRHNLAAYLAEDVEGKFIELLSSNPEGGSL